MYMVLGLVLSDLRQAFQCGGPEWTKFIIE